MIPKLYYLGLLYSPSRPCNTTICTRKEREREIFQDSADETSRWHQADLIRSPNIFCIFLLWCLKEPFIISSCLVHINSEQTRVEDCMQAHSPVLCTASETRPFPERILLRYMKTNINIQRLSNMATTLHDDKQSWRAVYKKPCCYHILLRTYDCLVLSCRFC